MRMFHKHQSYDDHHSTAIGRGLISSSLHKKRRHKY